MSKTTFIDSGHLKYEHQNMLFYQFKGWFFWYSAGNKLNFSMFSQPFQHFCSLQNLLNLNNSTCTYWHTCKKESSRGKTFLYSTGKRVNLFFDTFFIVLLLVFSKFCYRVFYLFHHLISWYLHSVSSVSSRAV